MSSREDDNWADYAQDEYETKLYEEHREEAIREFKSDRIGSYYRTNPDVARPAAKALAEARLLLRDHPTAALVMASASAEVALKAVLLRPVVHGLVHFESAAPLIAELTIKHTGIDRFRELLIEILATHGSVDLREFRREGARKKFCSASSRTSRAGGTDVHRAASATAEQAGISVAVATSILEDLFPAVLKTIGLHTTDGTSICVLGIGECWPLHGIRPGYAGPR